MPDELSLDDPADLAVDETTGEILDDAEDEEVDLAGWVWEAMEPPVRRERLAELRTWVHWLVRTYPWTHAHVTPCWYEHKDVREHLTALFVSWVRTYTPGSKRDTAEVEWIDALYRTMPRLSLQECGPQKHTEQRAREFKDTDRVFEVHSKVSDDMTAAAQHPGLHEMIRQGVEQ
ncbi:hypothetical protein [Streptomyces sp. NBRC 110465]|uniref:hypothetical protein n=1 Tax=Streptomyces sp. NBRC 110465 TaxID=1897621 RepID=UPI0009A0FC39|nr:hypothetical protein [Streptomyces sp. NBRC 110465]